MKSNKEHWRAFDKAWFEKNQKLILYFLNSFFIIAYICRWMLRMHKDLSLKEKVSSINPSSFSIDLPDNQRRTKFRTHEKYSKRMYYALFPIWWAMHFMDWLFIDKYVPELSFGFLTLTSYPQAGSGGGNVTCDGTIRNYVGGTTSWANLRGTAYSVSVDMTGTSNYACRIARDAGTSLWTDISRGFYNFDTSTLGAGSTVSDATFTCRGYNTGSSGITGDDTFAIVGFTPASANAAVNADFTQFGSTVFGSMTFANFKTFENLNVITLSASGRSYISLTGVTCLGSRVGADASGTEPSGTTSGDIFYQVYNADNTGTANDPTLTVTYTLPPGTPHIALRSPAAATNIILYVTPGVGENIWINVAGTMKQVSSVQINVAGTWKTVSAIYDNVSGTWKVV